jgi:L-aspartate semialdehyde sulfurtransferase
LAKTYEEINDKIKRGEAVVVTAEEMIDIVAERGTKAAAEAVDVVTTGTFGPMCSSGAMLCLGHAKPRMKIQKAWLNEVPAYAGLAAVDAYIGCTELAENDPANNPFPGAFRYGGGHVISDLVAGRDVRLRAVAYGTDCYPRRELDSLIRLSDINEAIMINPRNCYQNYNVAVNVHAQRPIYTYMGVLRPKIGNANFCSAGQLSPLLNDPFYRTIGIGTRVFLGGGVGYVYSQGTQHSPGAARDENGTPLGGAGTLALSGDMKTMAPKWVVGVSFVGYGVSLMLGVGIPIPILDEDMARFTSVSDRDLKAPIVDYSRGYPYFEGGPLGHVTYAELRSGQIEIAGQKVPTGSFSSYAGAREIAETLKLWVREGRFAVSRPVEPLPSADSKLVMRLLNERPVPGREA